MERTGPLGLYDQGFRHWLETQSESTERLTGHVSESWDNHVERELNVPRSSGDVSTIPRADLDTNVVIWVSGTRKAA